MSKYHKIKTQFTSRAYLRAALKATGIPFEEHEVEQHLVGYIGDTRPETATFIVRRANVSSGANDVGWHWNEETGCFEEIISSFDSVRRGGQITQQVRMEYAAEYAISQAMNMGYELVEKQYTEAGQIQLVIGGMV